MIFTSNPSCRGMLPAPSFHYSYPGCLSRRVRIIYRLKDWWPPVHCYRVTTCTGQRRHTDHTYTRSSGTPGIRVFMYPKHPSFTQLFRTNFLPQKIKRIRLEQMLKCSQRSIKAFVFSSERGSAGFVVRPWYLSPR